MYEYDEDCLKTFIKNQAQLFDEPVAETLEEAEAFLEDCMAAVVDSIEEVKEFLQEEGLDVDGMSDEEIEEASEVFALPGGRYPVSCEDAAFYRPDRGDEVSGVRLFPESVGSHEAAVYTVLYGSGDLLAACTAGNPAQQPGSGRAGDGALYYGNHADGREDRHAWDDGQT